MKSIKNLLFAICAFAIVVPMTAVAEAPPVRPLDEVVRLPDFRVERKRGAIDIVIGREGLDGRYGAISYILVTGVKPKSVYEKHGIKVGDELVSIQGLEFLGKDYPDKKVYEMLDSTPVTDFYEFEVRKIKLVVRRDRNGRLFVKEVVRDAPARTIKVPVSESLTVDVIAQATK